MFIEITQEAFCKIVTSETPAHKVEEKELARKLHFLSCGVHCLTVLNHVNGIEQFYIKDINA